MPSQVPGQAALPSLAPVLEKVLPAVVSVQVEGTAAPEGQKVPEELKKYFGDELPDQQAQPFEGLGSGVIINAAKGYVLTNNHVVNHAEKISVQLNDGREFDAKLIGSDDQSDIALLQLQNATNLTQIKIADSDSLRVGDFAIAVGNPFGLGQTATSGIISALGRSGLNLEGLENFIQTDASINRGNSGGALLNLNGELIGINTAILAPGGGSIGIGFAIPSNMAQTLANQLIQFGEIRRGLLGIKGTEMSADIAKAFNLNVQRGAFVSEVLANSGSAKAGIKPGDVIISLNGKPLSSFAELRSRIATTEPGTKVKLGLLRDGKPQEVEVTLDKSTASSASAEMIAPALQGATLSDGQLKDGTKGVTIAEVEKGSAAAQIGLHKDDVIIGVNRDRVRSIAEMRKVLESKPAVIALHVVRGNESIYLLLR
ncbi:serine protease [Franconibacter daqui]|nr:serine protease [Franconibacter daqui]